MPFAMQQYFVNDTNEGDPHYVVLSVKYFIQTHTTILYDKRMYL